MIDSNQHNQGIESREGFFRNSQVQRLLKLGWTRKGDEFRLNLLRLKAWLMTPIAQVNEFPLVGVEEQYNSK
jgi:hypothetical protein